MEMLRVARSWFRWPVSAALAVVHLASLVFLGPVFGLVGFLKYVFSLNQIVNSRCGVCVCLVRVDASQI